MLYLDPSGTQTKVCVFNIFFIYRLLLFVVQSSLALIIVSPWSLPETPKAVILVVL